MKKLQANIKPFKSTKIIKILRDQGIEDIYIEEVKEYALRKKTNIFLPRVLIQIFVNDQDVNHIKNIIITECFDLDEIETDVIATNLIEIIDIQTSERNILSNLQ
ncbi:MAG: hypothetical protein OEV44_08185 [Spirochaetota bacterium]|nr:hypothetical protein [Spirochaetota bacterium]